MPIVIFLVVVCAALFLFLKLRKSKFVGKLTDEIFEDVEEQSKEVISKIGDAENVLKQTAKEQLVEAEKLTKESVEIGDYLASRSDDAKAEETGKEPKK